MNKRLSSSLRLALAGALNLGLATASCAAGVDGKAIVEGLRGSASATR